MTTQHTSGIDERTLVEAARRGDRSAFEELYERHAPTAWRMALAAASTPEHAPDAVVEAFSRLLAGPSGGVAPLDGALRPALLAVARDAAIDAGRRRRDGSQAAAPEDVARMGNDGAVVAAAFADLPERWRSVLWLSEVEGVPAARAGATLGLPPHAVEQLATRARAGLRERYARAQATAASADCRRATHRLGAFASGRLARRDRRRIEHHLDGCTRCRERLTAIDQAVSHLRRLAPPLPLTLAASTADAWQRSRTVARGPLGLELPNGRQVPAWAEKTLVGSTAAVVSLGLAAAIALGARDATGRGPERNRAATGQAFGDDGDLALGTGTADLAPVDLPAGPALPPVNLGGGASAPAPPPGTASSSPTTAEHVRSLSGSAPTSTAAAPTTAPPTTEAPPPTDPPPTTAAPLVDLGLGDVATIELGPDCTGVVLLGNVIGCDPATGDGQPLP